MIDNYTDEECRAVLEEFAIKLAKYQQKLPDEILSLLEEHFEELLI